MAEIHYRGYRPGDEHAILDTFNLVFREVVGEDFVDRTLERWKWGFLDNPAGHRIWLGFADDGRVACQYAAMPLRIWCGKDGGRELSFFHAVDSMVHPEFRTGLRRRGAFLEVADQFFDTFGGKVDHLGFGYPIRPAWRIGERFLGYRLIRVIDFLLRPVGDAPSGTPGVSVRRLADDEPFPPAVDAWFAHVRDSFACTTIKDATYLDWRYRSCPDIDYHVLWAERGATPAGFLVVRTEGGLVPDSACIGDLLVDPSDTEALAALVGEAERLARAHGKKQLMTVQNPELAVGKAFTGLGFAAKSSADWLERKLGSRDFTSGLSQAWLAEHWSYELGDSDLF